MSNTCHHLLKLLLRAVKKLIYIYIYIFFYCCFRFKKSEQPQIVAQIAALNRIIVNYNVHFLLYLTYFCKTGYKNM